MPTQNKRSHHEPQKSSKVVVKSEPSEYRPLSEYTDDRVELLKQIFSSLKAKTIKAIAPAFLQDKPLDTIQDYCLDELLGISKKRLLSIINATKCPSDTETSDSDVEKVEEHISLEEISSDSADERPQPSKKNKPTVKKELSVLELLELQARARAIRSQLALEPVTKIELDSDDNSADEKTEKSNEKPNERNGTTVSLPPPQKPSKPVRLKRNFRQRQTDDLQETENKESEENQTRNTNENTREKSPKLDESKSKNYESSEPAKQNEMKKETEPERSPSPDVITIVPSPEMLCISSSDDEDESSNSNSTRPKYLGNISTPIVIREETEDEVFLRKIKEANASNASVHSSRNESESRDATDLNSPKELKDKKDNEIGKPERMENCEPEEGEIEETDEEDAVEIIETESVENAQEMDNKTEDRTVEVTLEEDEIRKDLGPEQDKEKEKKEELDADKEEDEEKEIVEESDREDENVEMIEIEDDEDIIDLGKDEDFEIRHDTEEEEEKEECSNDPNKSTTESKNGKEESWGSRWLKGDKITKIMATSKLANRMRTKIKQKKQESEKAAAEAAAAEIAAAATALEAEKSEKLKIVTEESNSKFEEGSIQQYEEICKEKMDS